MSASCGLESCWRGVLEVVCRPEPRPLPRPRSPVLVHKSHKSMLLDSYQIGSVLGEGSFGIVSAARCKHSGRNCVVKAVDRQCVHNIGALYDEVELQSELDHPHIVRVFETFEDAAYLYIVMERCRGGELYYHCQLGEPVVQDIFEQICRAVRYMHDHHIAHRDLKPENFLVRDEGDDARRVVKLIDFGLATRFSPGAARMETICGSMPYTAPEVLLGKAYDERCDVFSLGVLLFTLLTDRLPFSGNASAATRQILHSPVTFTGEEHRAISLDARGLAEKACAKVPARRPSVEGLLLSPWLQQAAPLDEVDGQVLRDLAGRSLEHCARSPFQQVALRLAAYYSEDARLEPWPQVFELLDADGDGVISKEEAERWDELVGSPAVSSQLFKHAGAPGEGHLDYNDFLVAFMDPASCLSVAACRSAFHALEDTSSGLVSPKKMCQVLELSYGKQWMRHHRGEVKAMCKEVRDTIMDWQAFVTALGMDCAAFASTAALGGA